MGIANAISFPRPAWLRGLKGKARKPKRVQIAALCYRCGDKEPEILLVSSRQRGRWILPKGWPETGRKGHETAMTEAYEEAGAVGVAEPKPIGNFKSFKGLSNGEKLDTRVFVFKVRIDKMLKKFPEKGQRKVRWVPISKAISIVDETDLSVFLKRHRHALTK